MPNGIILHSKQDRTYKNFIVKLQVCLFVFWSGIQARKSILHAHMKACALTDKNNLDNSY